MPCKDFDVEQPSVKIPKADDREEPGLSEGYVQTGSAYDQRRAPGTPVGAGLESPGACNLAAPGPSTPKPQ